MEYRQNDHVIYHLNNLGLEMKGDAINGYAREEYSRQIRRGCDSTSKKPYSNFFLVYSNFPGVS